MPTEGSLFTASIAGVEVMDLEDAVQALWKARMYAREAAWAAPDLLVMMSEANHDRAAEILKAAGYIS